MFCALADRAALASAGTLVAGLTVVMGRIELANSIAAAARRAQQRGEHKEAAELFARALRVLTEGAASEQVSDLWEQIRTHPPAKASEPPDGSAGWGRFVRESK